MIFSDLERKSGCDSFFLSVDNETLGSRKVYVQVIFIRDIRRRADLPSQKDSTKVNNNLCSVEQSL